MYEQSRLVPGFDTPNRTCERSRLVADENGPVARNGFDWQFRFNPTHIISVCPNVSLTQAEFEALRSLSDSRFPRTAIKERSWFTKNAANEVYDIVPFTPPACCDLS